MDIIGVIGNGYVGHAVASFFRVKGCDVRVYDRDPTRSIHEVRETCQADFVFICVPTPTDYRTQNLDAVATAIKLVNDYGGEHTTVVLKSTVLPGTCRELAEHCKHNLVFSPEFLSARTADQDFANPESIILGGVNVIAVSSLILRHFNQEPLIVGWEDAEMIKYARNAFYALKVAWWNEIYDLCQQQGVPYNVLKAGVLASGWINPMHCDVPGHDGKRGFGGKCLPKDSEALVAFAERHGVDMTILKAALASNQWIRGSE